ncbi:MAG: glycerol-3-phosphate acyltransferase, partial [Candidatus Marinimicrobia bacterium]|nr:glycerol-3-phosphate acyltransferase [Candidatus Neomarinimicrobiota bacterium]
MISPWIIFILVLILSYLTGSTPTSIIVGKLTKGIDIREHGSGNAGGTNVFRVLGWKPALVVVIVDVFKGWLPTAVHALHSINYINTGDVGILQILCGFFAV